MPPVTDEHARSGEDLELRHPPAHDGVARDGPQRLHVDPASHGEQDPPLRLPECLQAGPEKRRLIVEDGAERHEQQRPVFQPWPAQSVQGVAAVPAGPYADGGADEGPPLVEGLPARLERAGQEHDVEGCRVEEHVAHARRIDPEALRELTARLLELLRWLRRRRPLGDPAERGVPEAPVAEDVGAMGLDRGDAQTIGKEAARNAEGVVHDVIGGILSDGVQKLGKHVDGFLDEPGRQHEGREGAHE